MSRSYFALVALATVAACATVCLAEDARAETSLSYELRYHEVQTELANTSFSGTSFDKSMVYHDVKNHGSDLGVYSPRLHGIGMAVSWGGENFAVVEEFAFAFGSGDGPARDPSFAGAPDAPSVAMMRFGLEPRLTAHLGSVSLFAGTSLAVGRFALAVRQPSCFSICGPTLKASAWQGFAMPRIGFDVVPTAGGALEFTLGAMFGVDVFRLPGWELGLSAGMRIRSRATPASTSPTNHSP